MDMMCLGELGFSFFFFLIGWRGVKGLFQLPLQPQQEPPCLLLQLLRQSGANFHFSSVWGETTPKEFRASFSVGVPSHLIVTCPIFFIFVFNGLQADHSWKKLAVVGHPLT